MGKIAAFLLIWDGNPAKICAPDSASYFDTARALLHAGHFAVSPDQPEVPQIVRTPGYPVFLASLFFCFGENYAVLIFSQIALSLGTILLTYRLSARLWDDRRALAAAGLLALDLPSFMISQQVLTETLFTFALTLTVLAALEVLQPSKRIVLSVLLCSVLLALTTLIRPVTYYALPLIFVAFTIIWKRDFTWPWRKIGLLGLTLLTPWLILIGGWQARNYLAAGTTTFSAIQGVNLLFYRGAAIVAQRDNITFEAAQQRLGYGRYAALHPETAGWSTAQLNQRWQQEGLALIRQHPWWFVKTQIRGAAKMLLGPGEQALLDYWGKTSGQTGPGGDLFVLSLRDYGRKWILGQPGLFALFGAAELYLAIIYGGAFYAAYRLIRRRDAFWRMHLFIWGMIIYLIVVSAGPEAYARLRIPLMPLLALYAGHGILHATARTRRREVF